MVSEVTKFVSVLQAILWVAQAWKAVKEETISKCFQKAGVLDQSLSVASCVHEDQDPFHELHVDSAILMQNWTILLVSSNAK